MYPRRAHKETRSSIRERRRLSVTSLAATVSTLSNRDLNCTNSMGRLRMSSVARRVPRGGEYIGFSGAPSARAVSEHLV